MKNNKELLCKKRRKKIFIQFSLSLSLLYFIRLARSKSWETEKRKGNIFLGIDSFPFQFAKLPRILSIDEKFTRFQHCISSLSVLKIHNLFLILLLNDQQRVINVISSTSIPLHNVFIFHFVSRELWNPLSKLPRLLINPIRYYADPLLSSDPNHVHEPIRACLSRKVSLAFVANISTVSRVLSIISKISIFILFWKKIFQIFLI